MISTFLFSIRIAEKNAIHAKTTSREFCRWPTVWSHPSVHCYSSTQCLVICSGINHIATCTCTWTLYRHKIAFAKYTKQNKKNKADGLAGLICRSDLTGPTSGFHLCWGVLSPSGILAFLGFFYLQTQPEVRKSSPNHSMPVNFLKAQHEHRHVSEGDLGMNPREGRDRALESHRPIIRDISWNVAFRRGYTRLPWPTSSVSSRFLS